MGEEMPGELSVFLEMVFMYWKRSGKRGNREGGRDAR